MTLRSSLLVVAVAALSLGAVIGELRLRRMVARMERICTVASDSADAVLKLAHAVGIHAKPPPRPRVPR